MSFARRHKLPATGKWGSRAHHGVRPSPVTCCTGSWRRQVPSALFVAYQHLKINGAPTPAYVCLAGAALLALSPLKALGHAMFTVERGAMHLVHVVAGLALMALPVSGLVSGTPVLMHAALAPFAMMGAAQALMHSGKPRNAAQSQAMRSFVTSLRSCLEMTGARSPGKNKSRCR